MSFMEVTNMGSIYMYLITLFLACVRMLDTVLMDNSVIVYRKGQGWICLCLHELTCLCLVLI